MQKRKCSRKKLRSKCYQCNVEFVEINRIRNRKFRFRISATKQKEERNLLPKHRRIVKFRELHFYFFLKILCNNNSKFFFFFFVCSVVLAFECVRKERGGEETAPFSFLLKKEKMRVVD